MYRDVLLTSGEHLALDFTRPLSADRPFVIFLHGLGSDRHGEKALHLEREATRRGLGFARFDFRGHGSSAGSMRDLTISRCLEDLRAILAFLETEPRMPLERAILAGSSLGGLVSAWHCALAPGRVIGQLLIAPAFRIVERLLLAIDETGRERWQDLRRYHFVRPWMEFDLGYDLVTDSKRYPPDLLPRRTRVPTAIVHGTEDESVPIALSEDFVGACPEPRPRFVPVLGGDHRLTQWKELLAEELLSLADCLRSDARAIEPSELTTPT